MKRARRLLLAVLIVLVLVAAAGYLAASVVVYNQLSQTVAGCGSPEARGQTPAQFASQSVDTLPYQMATFQPVELRSRGDGIRISAWYVPTAQGDEADAPTVILVHGLTSCKSANEVLIPAGMLHRHGYNALLIDLRDHGESQIEDGRYAGGSEEWRDVLGAWDWLVQEKGFDPERIGIFGASLGAATAMVSFGEEPRVAALWEDSGFASIQEAVDAELTRNGFPTFLSGGALFVGRLISGDDIAAHSPLDAMSRVAGRPVFITHGTDDERLSVAYASQLADAVRAAGGAPEVWIVEGSTHVAAMFDHTGEYEQRLTAFFDAALRSN